MQFTYCPSCGSKDTVQKQDATNYECRTCHWHFWNNAKAATALALINSDGQLLVVKRAREPNKGKYELAGGFVDYGEDAYDGAIREAREELSITIAREDLQLLDAYHNDYNPGIATIDLAFLVTKWDGQLQPGDDVAEFLWQPLNVIYSPDFCQPYYTGLDAAIRTALETRK